MCSALPFIIADQVFHITCFVFPLCIVDIIFGVTWLTQLGDVIANWATLSMEFTIAYQPMWVQRDPSLTRHVCGHADLLSLEGGDDAWLLLAMESGGAVQFPSLPSLSVAQRGGLEKLLSEFPAVTRPTAGLPPSRMSDHQIVLQEGVAPVSFRPYRYNHFQKDEMEKLIAEMLAVGIIQPSCGPYSSPVLLVHKKDDS